MSQVCVITRSVGRDRHPDRASPSQSRPHRLHRSIAPGDNIRPFEELTQAFAEEHSVDLRTIELRVLSKSSISAAIDTVMKALEGRLDTLVHSASHMTYGLAEVFTTRQFMHLYDVNCVGTQRIDKIALPDMSKVSQGLLG